MELNIYSWMLLELAAFLQGVSKGGLPGVGALAVPLAAMALPAKLSTGVILPILILGDFVSVSVWRRSADWHALLRALPWAIVGIVVGYFLMGRINDAQLRPIIGAIVLLMLIMHIWRKQTQNAKQRNGADPAELPGESRMRRGAFAALMGFAGGVTTMMANAAGPVMALYLLALRLPKLVFVGTAAWFFLIVNWIKVPFSVKLGLIQTETLQLNVLMAPVLLLGIFAGVVTVKRISEQNFERLVMMLTMFAAIKLFF